MADAVPPGSAAGDIGSHGRNTPAVTLVNLNRGRDQRSAALVIGLRPEPVVPLAEVTAPGEIGKQGIRERLITTTDNSPGLIGSGQSAG